MPRVFWTIPRPPPFSKQYIPSILSPPLFFSTGQKLIWEPHATLSYSADHTEMMALIPFAQGVSLIPCQRSYLRRPRMEGHRRHIILTRNAWNARVPSRSFCLGNPLELEPKSLNINRDPGTQARNHIASLGNVGWAIDCARCQ
jgi:hypothetical protein